MNASSSLFLFFSFSLFVFHLTLSLQRNYVVALRANSWLSCQGDILVHASFELLFLRQTSCFACHLFSLASEPVGTGSQTQLHIASSLMKNTRKNSFCQDCSHLTELKLSGSSVVNGCEGNKNAGPMRDGKEKKKKSCPLLGDNLQQVLRVSIDKLNRTLLKAFAHTRSKSGCTCVASDPWFHLVLLPITHLFPLCSSQELGRKGPVCKPLPPGSAELAGIFQSPLTSDPLAMDQLGPIIANS